ncbi:MAG: hypothetical protein HC880_08510 [Bacteroidia bacterium]|nr:hypothetical protein [Bacteroidia bacterium]
MLKHTLAIKTILLSTLMFLNAPLVGQVSMNYYLPQNIAYDALIPRPDSMFGFNIGEWHLSHDQVVSYLKTWRRPPIG